MKPKIKVAVIGRGAMGMPLIERLEKEGHHVALSCTSKRIWSCNDMGLGDSGAVHRSLNSEADIAANFDPDPNMKGVEVMFLAIPSGEHETPLINYCLSKGIYPILFCKSDLATNYARRRSQRHLIGANATVGGRIMALPWLRMQYLLRKQYVLYAYLNASMNFFMDEVAVSGSLEGAFKKAKALHLAEPGSDDYVAFVNTELGGDYPKKISIAMNDAMLGDGPYMSPDQIHYVPLDADDIERYTLPTHRTRYLIRIDNTGAASEFELDAPGSLYAQLGDFTVYGGFCDVSRDNSLANWMKPGSMNGIQIRFKRESGYEGQMELAGLGAGDATVGAAMNDFYEYLMARNGRLVENLWPAWPEHDRPVSDLERTKELLGALAGSP
jgi:homoserine dehydrogenase